MTFDIVESTPLKIFSAVNRFGPVAEMTAVAILFLVVVLVPRSVAILLWLEMA